MRRPRTLVSALKNAERIRRELPGYIYPSPEDYDMVMLADAVLRWASPNARRVWRKQGVLIEPQERS